MSPQPDFSIKSFFEEAPVPVFLLNPAGDILYVNPACQSLFALQPDGQMAHLTRLISSAVQPKAFLKELNETVGQTKRLEVRIELSSGLIKTIGFNSSLYKNHPDSGILVVFCHDLTDLTITQGQLEKSENRFRDLIQNSSLGLLEVDNDEIIKHANLSFCSLTGYTPEELVGRHAPSLLLPPDDTKSNQQLTEVQEKRRSGVSDAYELRIVAKNREPKWVLISGAPIYNNDGKVIGSMGIHHDITFAKRAEEELRKALQKEADLNQLKTRFITLTSHEFRTPLTTIQSSAELLSFSMESSDSFNKEKFQRYINRITQEVARLTGLMNDILVLGRVEAGRIAMNAQPVDLVQLTRDLIDAGHFLQSDSRSLHLTILGNPVPVEVDASLISHIYQNLFSNALKYSPGKEEPVVTLEYLSDRCRISVRDFGIGIPDQDIKNLFQTFYRASNVENIQGTGLGLTIVKQFVELHGGKLFVETFENSGSCFTFEVYLKLPS